MDVHLSKLRGTPLSEISLISCVAPEAWVLRYRLGFARTKSGEKITVVEATDFVVQTLGPCRVDSPLAPLLAARFAVLG